MIIDNVKNINMYEVVVPGISEAIIKIRSIEKLEDGLYELENGYFMVQSGETKSIYEGTFESHRKYIDVQILLEGCEELAWNDIRELREVVPYDKAKDAVRWDGEKEHHILISEGMFYIMFPNDGHKAISHMDKAYTYRKIVLKLPIKL
ncbi:YhcH/YjgK/YiaL family protein [Eubacterium sp. MSJ-13]|uniref:YhcH/YjgK/YiaL family protein n=1 Tax=Eubacterium sp. MSJ-13 TaxID=2841513 RepID=UPI001C100BD9|nr:YhcH/YjgK/YiaL family protein [Eubacterium sp. MSJ-13]MBU5478646.1 YhcH/YjgK/YiaL family protein [Eubacterium sp. MSJ-13]